MNQITIMEIIIGNIIGGLCGLFCILSTFCKDKKGIMKLQCMDCTCGILSCLVLRGFSGAVTQAVNLTRNLFVYKNKITNKLQVVFIILIIGTGFAFNNRGLFGLLPIIASVEYTAIVMKSENAGVIKAGLAVNNILWFIYELIIMNYLSCFFAAMIIITSIFNVFRDKKKQK